MFAIIRKEDDVVICTASTPFTITADSVTGSGWQLNEYNTSNVTQIEVDDIPEFYINGAWSYKNGTWTALNTSAVNVLIERKKENKWSEIRLIRNGLLNESDIHVTIDRWEAYTEEKKEEWKIYRQALRDITKQEDPFNIIFPVKPQ